MSTWSDLRETVGLARGKAPWGVVCTVMVLFTAGWLLQQRVFAPDTSELDYSTLCKYIDEGKVAKVVIKGQAVEGDFAEPQTVAGHRTKIFRATGPGQRPDFPSVAARQKSASQGGRTGSESSDPMGARRAAALALSGPWALGIASVRQPDRPQGR